MKRNGFAVGVAFALGAVSALCVGNLSHKRSATTADATPAALSECVLECKVEAADESSSEPSQSSGESRQNMVVRLNNAPAQQIANAVTQFYQQQRELSQNSSPHPISIADQQERDVVVVPEIVSNNLLISSTPQNFPGVLEMIKKLDTVSNSCAAIESGVDNVAQIPASIATNPSACPTESAAKVNNSISFTADGVNITRGTETSGFVLFPTTTIDGRNIVSESTGVGIVNSGFRPLITEFRPMLQGPFSGNQSVGIACSDQPAIVTFGIRNVLESSPRIAELNQSTNSQSSYTQAPQFSASTDQPTIVTLGIQPLGLTLQGNVSLNTCSATEQTIQFCAVGSSEPGKKSGTVKCKTECEDLEVGCELPIVNYVPVTVACCDRDLESLAPVAPNEEESARLTALREQLSSLVKAKSELMGEKSLQAEISTAETAIANLRAARKIFDVQQSLQKVIDEFPSSPAAERAKAMLEKKPSAKVIQQTTVPVSSLPLY